MAPPEKAEPFFCLNKQGRAIGLAWRRSALPKGKPRKGGARAGLLQFKSNGLLDATLGMINIEQNSIIKIFSVAAVIFMPPTMIASIYGMNFDVMPELQWALGYPLAILLMVGSAALAIWYFKRNGWL